MSDSMQILAPTLLMVALLSLVIVGLLIYVRASRAMQLERDEQRRVQTRLTVEKQEAEGRSASLTHGLTSTSQACRQAVQQLPLADDAKSLALGLMALLPKLPVPVDNAAPYRQSLKGHALELDRLELLVATVNNTEVTQRWVHGSYQDLCEIPLYCCRPKMLRRWRPKIAARQWWRWRHYTLRRQMTIKPVCAIQCNVRVGSMTIKLLRVLTIL